MSRNDKFEVIASYGGGPIEVVKETHVERGYSSWYVRKRYSKDGRWHTTPYLRSINEMKAACHAFTLAIAAEERADYQASGSSGSTCCTDYGLV